MEVFPDFFPCKFLIAVLILILVVVVDFVSWYYAESVYQVSGGIIRVTEVRGALICSFPAYVLFVSLLLYALGKTLSIILSKRGCAGLALILEEMFSVFLHLGSCWVYVYFALVLSCSLGRS